MLPHVRFRRAEEHHEPEQRKERQTPRTLGVLAEKPEVQEIVGAREKKRQQEDPCHDPAHLVADFRQASRFSSSP
jgi:hypothetical protein